MGQIAEDMADGTCCTYCNAYFEGDAPNECGTHGYPVLCKDCWDDLNPSERREAQEAGLQRASYRTL